MNRAIVIPAGCCLVAVPVLLATLHGESNRSSASASTNGAVTRQAADSDTSQAFATSGVPILPKTPLMSEEEARRRLTELAGEYSQPWREWENSPRHLYSRAGPRSIPPISVDVVIDLDATAQNDNLLLATVTIKVGTRSGHVPCVVDRISKRVWFAGDGGWLTQEQWLKKAPIP